MIRREVINILEICRRNCTWAGNLAIDGIIALSNSDKLQDLSEKSVDAQFKYIEKEHEKLQKTTRIDC